MPDLNAIYDLEVSPITFDFTKFMLLAEHYRQKHGYQQLVVSIVMPSESRLLKMAEKYSNLSDGLIAPSFLIKRIKQVLLPLIGLVNSQARHQIIEDRERLYEHIDNKHLFPPNYKTESPVSTYGLGDIRDLNNLGETLPSINTDDVTCSEFNSFIVDNAITIDNTLAIFIRQTPYEPWRNSNVGDWLEFAEKRISEGYQIVWFTDVESSERVADGDLPGVVCDHDGIAFKSIFIAKCAASFFVNGGLATLARYNHSAVSATFKMCDVKSPATSKQFWSNRGIVVGEQLGFLSPFHHNDWRQDNIGAIEDVWEHIVKPRTSLDMQEKTGLIQNWQTQIKSLASKPQPFVVEVINDVADVYIWGSGKLASNALLSLTGNGYKVLGIIDSYQYGKEFEGFTLLHPNQLPSQNDQTETIIVALGDQSNHGQFQQILKYCKRFVDIPCRLFEFKH